VRNVGVVFWLCESSYRWVMGGSIRRRWRLRRRLMRAVTWREYSAAGLELDELDELDESELLPLLPLLPRAFTF
jgi:hypothetical protein